MELQATSIVEPHQEREVATVKRRCSFGLQTDPIVDGVSEPLLAADVSLGRLDALVAEQKLDLLDLAAGVVTQAGASAPQIMWSDTGQTALTAGGRHH